MNIMLNCLDEEYLKGEDINQRLIKKNIKILKSKK